MEYTPETFDAVKQTAQELGLLDDQFGFVADVVRKGEKRELSPRQWEALVNAVQREAKYAAERQAKIDQGVRVLGGKGEFVAKVLSVKWKDGQFPAYKMTVEVIEGPAKGVRLWGTLPKALDDQEVWRAGEGYVTTQKQAERGDVVRFTASVTPSDRDQTFGFFKRPRDAEFVSRVNDEPVAEVDHTLGPCGCVDYHYADCPTRGGVYV